MLDLENQVSLYADHLERRYPDVTFEEIVDRATQPSFLGPPPVRRRGLVVALAVGVIVLVVVGGVAFFSGMLTPDPSPVVTHPEEIPETTVVEPPPEMEVGGQQALDTSLGRWVWTRVDWEGSGSPEPSVIRDRSVEWSTPPPPLPQLDGTEWGWNPLNNTDSARFGEVTITLASVGGQVDWARFYSYEPGWVEAEWEWTTECRPGSGTMSACPKQGSILEIVGMQDFPTEDGLEVEHRRMEVLARIEVRVVSGDPDAVEFRDQDTGELVLRLEATDPEVSAEQLFRSANTCDPFSWCGRVWKLFVDGPDRAWVNPPWFGVPVDTVAVAAGAQGFVIVGIDRLAESPTLYTWRSADGVAWEPLAPPPHPEIPFGEFDTRLHLVGDGSLVVLVIEVPDVAADIGWSQVWTSTDGSDWQRAEIDVAKTNVDVVARTSSAWMILGYRHPPSGAGGFPRCEVWVSADTVAWERIPMPAESRPATGSGCHLAGDTVELITELMRPSEEVFREDFQLWYGSFEE